ncbi:MAG: CarD family transcriptional regulator [Rhodobacteraceae bacterium]|nr:CarD family transcriptional regulator [Paracoccaceae bacterium]
MGRKKKVLDFSVGDYVVYPAHGVGQITGIDNFEVSGNSMQMFTIYVKKDKLTIRVPTNRAVSIGMRALASPEIVEKAMTILKGKAVVKKLMWSRRAQEYDQKINSGDIIQIAEVVRDLHRHDDQREQSYSERQLFESAFDRLGREIAIVSSTSQDSASDRMEAVLRARSR